MIDAACFPGSSGSPIFIANEGFVHSRNGGITAGMSRYRFVGVLYAGPVVSATGRIQFQAAPTSNVPFPVVETMMNLGLCVKSSRLTEFAPALRRMGVLSRSPNVAATAA